MVERVHPTTSIAGERIDGIVTIQNSIVDGATRPTFAPVQDREEIGNGFNAVGTWTVLGNDTITLATSVEHVFGTKSLSFAKTNGAANTVIGGIQDTITSVDLTRFGPSGAIEVMMQVSSIANVAKAFVRLGTDSSNYNEWQLDVSEITAGVWTFKRMLLSGSLNVVGNGWDQSAVTYMAVGTVHALETDALSDILFDSVFMVGGQMTVAGS